MATNTTTNTATTAVADKPADFSSAVSDQPMLSGLIPLLPIIALMYFLLIRPNQKRIKDHETMLKALRRGDKVVTGGGIIGTIYKIEDDALVVEVAPDVKVRVVRDTISHVVSKTIANDNKEDK